MGFTFLIIIKKTHLTVNENQKPSVLSVENLVSFWWNWGKADALGPSPSTSPTPWGSGTRSVAPPTCNPDVIDGDHFIQLQQELLGEAGQVGYEKPAVLPGGFLQETWGNVLPVAAGREACLQRPAEGGLGKPAGETKPKP